MSEDAYRDDAATSPAAKRLKKNEYTRICEALGWQQRPDERLEELIKRARVKLGLGQQERPGRDLFEGRLDEHKRLLRACRNLGLTWADHIVPLPAALDRARAALGRPPSAWASGR